MITTTEASSLLDYINSLGRHAELILAPGCKPICSNAVFLTEDELRKFGIQEVALDDCKFYEGKTLHWPKGGDKAVLVHEFAKERLQAYAERNWVLQEKHKRQDAAKMERGG